MKTITIPKRFGYPTLDIKVNGNVYTVKSGEEITVEDHVAEVIENAIALEPKPKRYLNKLAQFSEGSITEITSSDLDGIETIVPFSLSHCKSVIRIAIPNSVNDIDDHAFYSCSKLEVVDMGNGVQSIGVNVFDWCVSLFKVFLPETPPTLADTNAFANINPNCIFYCKTQKSLEAYRSAANWSTLAETYTFKVE